MKMYEMHTNMRAHKGTRARTHAHAHSTRTQAFANTSANAHTRIDFAHRRTHTPKAMHMTTLTHGMRVCTTASADSFIYPKVPEYPSSTLWLTRMPCKSPEYPEYPEYPGRAPRSTR